VFAARNVADGHAGGFQTEKGSPLLARLLKTGNIEVVRDLAEAFPLEVFPDAVGLTPSWRENLLPYSSMVFNSFGSRKQIFQFSTQAAEPVLAWIHAQCAGGACADVGFAADIWAAHDGGEITAEEAPILVRSLLTAGLDTTGNGFANAILAFATHPEQWQRVRAITRTAPTRTSTARRVTASARARMHRGRQP
jgi:cytochrome P450